MTTYSTQNPLGSADPRDLYDNAENLDEAVNDLNSETWTDRFGVERPSLALLEQLRDAANAIVGGSEDVTQAWRSAIKSGVDYRIADNPLSYTATLEEGRATQRPPIPDAGDETFIRGAASSGAAFSVVAPALVAVREMVLIPDTGKLGVKIVSGVSEGVLNDDFYTGVAWYDTGKNRLTDVPSTARAQESLTAARYVDSFTVGGAGSSPDIIAPDGAVYMIPYFGTDSTAGRFWAAELIVTDYIVSPTEIIYPLTGFEGDVGQSSIEYSHQADSASAPPVPQDNVSYGGSGARITIIGGSDRSALALRGLLPVKPDGTLSYDVFCGMTTLLGDAGTVEIGAAWFDQNQAFLSESVAKSIEVGDLTLSVDTKVVRSSLFDAPAGSVYARPFVRIQGDETQVAVLSLFSRSHLDLNIYGETGHPVNVLPADANVHSFDPASSVNLTMTSSGVQSVRDDGRAENFQFIGGSPVRPETDVVDGYPALVTPVDNSVKARLVAANGVIYSPPCTLVFAARADSSVPTLRPLIHQNGASGNALRINANCVRTQSGLWQSRPGRVGIEIEGSSDGKSSDGNPLNASLPQDEWGVLSLVLRLPPERSEWWCNGGLVDTFLAPETIVGGRTDLFSAINTSWDTDGAALGRICAANIAVSDDQRMSLERWVSEPASLPLAINRFSNEQPQFLGTSFSVMRLTDGAVLFDQDAYVKQNPASIVKTVVALIANRWVIDWHEETVTLEGSQHGLEEGDVISVFDAVCAMLMPSSNITPTAVGLLVGEIIQDYEGVIDGETARARAYREMRNVSQDLGMVFPSYDGFFGGTPSGTQMSAIDVCRGMQYIYSSPRVFDCMSRGSHNINVVGGPNPRVVTITTSLTPLVDGSNNESDIIAGKTGTTSSTGESLTVLAKMPGGDVVAATLLGSPSDPGRFTQMRQMLDYVRKTFY